RVWGGGLVGEGLSRGGVGGGGVGLGVLGRWWVPAIDVGIGTLSGMVAMGVAPVSFGYVMTLAESLEAVEEASPAVWRGTPLSRAARLPQPPRKRSRRRSPPPHPGPRAVRSCTALA